MGEKDLINLKEAAKLSGYTPDYVGQLIRSGKISGKQVYCNIAWMTTAKDVLNYKSRSKEKPSLVKDAITARKRKISLEFSIIRLFFQTFRSALPLVIIAIVTFIFLLSFILFLIFNNSSITVPVLEVGTPDELTF